MLTPTVRRFTFTTHITSSVGWIGAAMAFLALAVIGFISDDPVKVRGAYLLMAPAAWFVLVPLAHASLLSGIVALITDEAAAQTSSQAIRDVVNAVRLTTRLSTS